MMFHKSKKDVLNGNIFEQIMIFTIPMMSSYLITQLYQFVDSIVLGRYAGVEAMAAVGGSATTIINILVNFISGLAAGVMILVAQNYGKGSVDGVKKAVKSGIFLAITFGGIMTIISALASKPLLIALNCPSETIKDSLIYMYLWFAGLIPYTIYKVGEYILNAAGDTKISILFTIVTAITKISLDLLLTGLLNMGVWGVAISNFASFLICGIIVLVILHRTPNIYQFDISEFGFDLQTLKAIIKNGVPVGIQSAVFSVTNVVISAHINNFGTNAIAAFSAYNNVDNFYWSFTNALGAAMITLVGQNYGNKNMKRVRKILIDGTIIHFFATGIIGAGVYFYGRDIATIFTTDTEVLDIMERMIQLTGRVYFTYILDEMISSTIKGCGDSMHSMIISLIGICAVRLIFLAIYKFTTPAEVLYCYPLSWFITSVIFLVYYLSRKKYRLTQSD